MRALLRAFRRDERGLAGVEFLIILPFMLLLILGTVEVVRYAYLHMKLQNVAANVADIISRPDQVAASDLSNLFTAAPVMMRPFQAGARMRLIVSGVVVENENDPPEIAWQASGGGTLGAASEVGSAGGVADVPEGLVYFGGEALIVAEIVYNYEPLFMRFAGGGFQRKMAYFRPRRGTLAAIN